RVANEFGEFFEENRIFIPFFLDRTGQLMRDCIGNRRIALRLSQTASLDRNIVEDGQRLNERDNVTSYHMPVQQLTDTFLVVAPIYALRVAEADRGAQGDESAEI